MSYMVMEVHTSYCVVMDELGRFIKAANLNYEVGQTLERVEAMLGKAQTQSRLGRRAQRVLVFSGSLAACLLIALSVALSLNFSGSPTLAPYAAVYLSINPEVRLDVSEDGRVVHAVALNADGDTLLEGYGAEGKELALVADELMRRAVEQGFLSDGGRVKLSIDAPNDSWFERTGMVLRQALGGILSEQVQVSVEITRYVTAEDASGASGPPSGNDKAKPPTPLTAVVTPPAGETSIGSSPLPIDGGSTADGDDDDDDDSGGDDDDDDSNDDDD